MTRYSESKQKGCPTCAGNDPKSCMRCHGKTRLREWWWMKHGLEWWPGPGEPPEGWGA